MGKSKQSIPGLDGIRYRLVNGCPVEVKKGDDSLIPAEQRIKGRPWRNKKETAEWRVYDALQRETRLERRAEKRKLQSQGNATHPKQQPPPQKGQAGERCLRALVITHKDSDSRRIENDDVTDEEGSSCTCTEGRREHQTSRSASDKLQKTRSRQQNQPNGSSNSSSEFNPDSLVNSVVLKPTTKREAVELITPSIQAACQLQKRLKSRPVEGSANNAQNPPAQQVVHQRFTNPASAPSVNPASTSSKPRSILYVVEPFVESLHDHTSYFLRNGFGKNTEMDVLTTEVLDKAAQLENALYRHPFGLRSQTQSGKYFGGFDT